MDQNKRIMVSLPEYLVDELDAIGSREQLSRSAMVREAMAMYVQQRKRHDLAERMQRGYMEMGAINLNMAVEAFLAEEEASYTLRHKASGV
jgi:CopG family transcriptional regulator/antitoxin EndoAI